MKYQVFDLETENHKVNKRFASPFSEKNWVVMRGWKVQGDKECSYSHHPENETTYMNIDDDITLLVGHNIKFDLLYEWGSDDMKAFFKRGGKIWDTQYAEYLLKAQHPNAQMVAMDQIVAKYGGRKKIDAVKALWDMGMLTSEIDSDMLKDYLIGTKEEGYNSGDIGNTELIFLGQIKEAHKLGMLTTIMARMDGLLCTTEMEYNGLKIDVHEAKRRMNVLTTELKGVELDLVEYLPTMPEECPFNWNSTIHKSSLVFGGTIKYRKQTTYIDPATGKLARSKTKAKFPLFDGIPINPNECVSTNGLYPALNQESFMYNNTKQDTFVSGRKKGEPKFKNVPVEGKLKVKFQDFFITLDGYTEPEPMWQGAQSDGAGSPIYSTAAEVIESLGSRGIPFLKVMALRQSITKDLGTYYLKYDEKKKEYVGLLTCVKPSDHIVNHSLNHTNTVTGRLSSSNPNLQNIPKKDKSEVKKMFKSRFDNGSMMEIDYSQLEVVVQGVLSKDEQLCIDLNNKVDFHCKRVSAKFGIPYDEAYYRCHDETYEEHELWKLRRAEAKGFSFQRAYGAGAKGIAQSTGINIDDVNIMIEVEECMYLGIVHFNQAVEKEVKSSAQSFRDYTRNEKVYRRGYHISPTGTRYSFRSYDAPEWLKDRGIQDSFMPTEMKNYPVQGLGGEIVQIILGKLFRHFVANNNYNGKVLLCNTVHDCVWFDISPDVDVNKVARELKQIMESVPEVLESLFGMTIEVPFPVEVETGSTMYNLSVLHI